MTRLARLSLLLALLPIACGGTTPATRSAAAPAAEQLPPIDGNAVLQHVKVLSSDEYGGRAPGTKGEDLSVAYIEKQFQDLGLAPGNTDGTYIQKVPLVGITPDPSASLVFRKGSKVERLKFKDDFVASTSARAGDRRHRQVRPRLRRLRRGRARVPLGRLQGDGREGQDAGHARQRPARCPTRTTRRSSIRRCSAAGR